MLYAVIVDGRPRPRRAWLMDLPETLRPGTIVDVYYDPETGRSFLAPAWAQGGAHVGR